MKLRRSLPLFALCLFASWVVYAGMGLVSTLTEPTGNIGYTASAFDPVNNLIYMASINTSTNSPFFSVYNASNFTYSKTVAVPTTLGVPVSANIDSTRGFIYFGVRGPVGQVVKVQLSNQTVISSATFQLSERFVQSGVIDVQNNFGYYGTIDGEIIKVNLSNMTRVGSISSTIFGLSTALIDTNAGFAYFGGGAGLNGAVSKIQLSNFTFVSSITLSGIGGVTSGIIDTTNHFAYFGSGDSPGGVVSVNLSNFAVGTTLTLPPSQDGLLAAGTDGTYGYFGTFTIPAQVVQISLTNMTEISSTTLAGVNEIQTGTLDVNSGFGYFGTNNFGSTLIAKVDLLAGALSISRQPSSVSVHPGETATFTLVPRGTATGYQWQRNGVAISGATSSSYTTPPVSLSDNGAQYNCVVTGLNSTQVTSAAATLTILPSIKVFPNPWRADRHTGGITFDGLPPNSKLKIFTLSGQWVRELTPTNGTVLWDRTNDVGQSVASGYYFYIVKASDDQQTSSGKLAILK
jgi:hypothetical protein